MGAGSRRSFTLLAVLALAYAQPRRESQAVKAQDAALATSMGSLACSVPLVGGQGNPEAPSSSATIGEAAAASQAQNDHQSPHPEPKTMVAWACLILNTASPTLKVHYTKLAHDAFLTGRCTRIGGGSWRRRAERQDDLQADHDEVSGVASWVWERSAEEIPPEKPPRQSDNVVKPGFEAKRGKGGTERGRIALLRA